MDCKALQKAMSGQNKAIVQTALSLIVVCFCLYKLADKATGPEEKALFWGGLSGILGYWLPSPSETEGRHLLVTKQSLDENL